MTVISKAYVYKTLFFLDGVYTCIINEVAVLLNLSSDEFLSG
jgi:hypothetical protein